MKNYNFLVVFAIFLLMNMQAFAEPYCEVQSVAVNGKVIAKDGIENIVIKSSDTIVINYGLKEATKMASESFYYRVVLKNEIDSSYKVTGVSSAVYVNLNEGDYDFIVSAFDLSGSWLARSESITFRVSDSEAKLLETIAYNIEEIENLKTKIAETDPNANHYDIFSAAVGVLIGAFLSAILVFVLMKLFGSKNKKSNKGGKMDNNENNVVSKDEFNKVQSENSNLRAEIAALRGQIDAMQSRATEMKKQNKDLQESLDQLSASKDELEKLQIQKDELFALIIHDIKNPAALIKSLVDLLRSYDLSAVEQQEIINDIAETTSRIVSLSHEVSKILALETSKLVLDFEPVQISEILNDVVRRNKIGASSKGITMTSDIAENLPDVELDVQKIDEVIDNLVSNALKFTQTGGKVHVKSSIVNNAITIEVTDNGLGLSEADVRNAFQRGSRLSAQPTSGESSTGLGLWIVKKLIDAHNGRVWVKSTLGKGSTFAFSVPLKQNNDSGELE